MKRKDCVHLGCDKIQFGEDTNVSEESAASSFKVEETTKSQKTTMLCLRKLFYDYLRTLPQLKTGEGFLAPVKIRPSVTQVY
jgi:hypothetical protein